MANITLPSVQSLIIEMMAGGTGIATGTAFVAESGKGPVLLTNRHNVTGRHPVTSQPLSPTGAVPDSLRILHNRANKLGEWVLRTERLYANHTARWHQHPTLGDRADFVALPLTDLNDVQVYPHQLAGGPPISVGPAEPVSVVGFPFGLQA